MEVWLIRRAMGPQTSVEGIFKSHSSAIRWFNKNAKVHEQWMPSKTDSSKRVVSWTSEYHGGEIRLERWEVKR